MLNRLEYLELMFENCEVARIPGKYIGEFEVSDIRTEIKRIGCNAIEQIEIAYEFFCEIHPDATNIKSIASWSDMSLRKRILSYDDVSSIEFSLVTDAVYYGLETKNEENSKTYSYYLHWVGNDEGDNTRQKSYLTGDGWLYLCVGSKDYDSMISGDAEEHQFTADMCDIGDANYERAKEWYMSGEAMWEEN